MNGGSSFVVGRWVGSLVDTVHAPSRIRVSAAWSRLVACCSRRLARLSAASTTVGGGGPVLDVSLGSLPILGANCSHCLGKPGFVAKDRAVVARVAFASWKQASAW